MIDFVSMADVTISITITPLLVRLREYALVFLVQILMENLLNLSMNGFFH